MVDLSVNLAGMQMDNPVVPASGTFGFGKEFKDIYDINILGSRLRELLKTHASVTLHRELLNAHQV